MADQPNVPTPPTPPVGGPKPIAPGMSRPVPPPPPANVPTTPPQGLVFKDANLSHLTPSPAPFSPAPSPTAPPAPPKPAAPPAAPPIPAPQRPMPPPPTPPVRTMSSDLGVKPSGVTLPPPPAPKEPPASVFRPTIPPTPGGPKVSPPPIPPRPLAPPTTTGKPATPVAIPPPHSGGNKKWIIVAIVAVLVIGGLVWFFAFRSTTPEPTPTPTSEVTETPTITPTPPPADFEQVFSHESTNLEYQTHNKPKTALAELSASIGKQTLAAGDLRMYHISRMPDGTEATVSLLATDLGVTVPADLMATIASGSRVTFSLFGKSDATNGRGFLLKLQPSANPEPMLATWEAAMVAGLKDIFKLTTAHPASPGFLENAYQGVTIHYRNFPDALSSIDYAVLTMPNGDRYLAFTNSRDHVFLLINKTLSVVPGK